MSIIGALRSFSPEGVSLKNPSIVGGVESPSKKLDLHRLVELSQLNVLFLQETLGNRDVISLLLGSLLKSWNFVGMDAIGRLGGLIIG
jgi:hypothetical protein